MKKAASLLTLCTFAAALNAAEVTVYGPASGRASVTTPAEHTSAADTLILDSSGGDGYTADPATTYASVSVINGENAGYARFAIGGLTIDANSSVANYNALSADKWDMNYFTLNFRNTNASAASVNIDANTFNIWSAAAAPGVQYQYVNFKDTYYNFNAATVNLGNTGASYAQNTSTMTIDEGATLKWKGTNFYIKQNGILNVNGSLIRNGGTFRLDQAGATMNINDGATFDGVSSTNLVMVAGATMNIGTDCNVNFVPGDNLTLNGTINSASNITFTLLTSAGTLTQTAGGIVFKRSSTMNSGANWTAYDKVTLAGTDDTDALMAKLIINDGATFTIANGLPRVIFQGHNDLILNKANAILDQDTNPVQLVTITSSLNNNVHINADQTFDRVYVNGGENVLGSGYGDLSIYLDGNSVLRFTYTTSFSSTNAYLKIFNFEEDSVYFNYKESVAAAVSDYVKLYSGDTEESFIGMGVLGTDGWLTAAIPEPSTYAALLGALALGLAAYRRRK
jgi:hypothetical protein